MSRRKFLQTTRSKVIFCVAGLTLSAFWLILNLDISFSTLIPSDSALESLRRQQKEEKKKWEAMQQQLARLDDTERDYRLLLESAWLELRDGSADVEIPRRIREAAQLREVTLQNVNAVKRTRVNNDLFLLEVDLRAVGTISTFTAFWGDLAALKPAMVWRRIEIRSMMSMQTEGDLYLNGTLRIIGREPTAEETAAAQRAAEAKTESASETPAPATPEATSATTPAPAPAEKGNER